MTDTASIDPAAYADAAAYLREKVAVARDKLQILVRQAGAVYYATHALRTPLNIPTLADAFNDVAWLLGSDVKPSEDLSHTITRIASGNLIVESVDQIIASYEMDIMRASIEIHVAAYQEASLMVSVYQAANKLVAPPAAEAAAEAFVATLEPAPFKIMHVPAAEIKFQDVIDPWPAKYDCRPGEKSILKPDGRYYFYDADGKLHRDELPAIIGGDKVEYYKHGMRHRSNGPAIEWNPYAYKGQDEWWTNGVKNAWATRAGQ